MAGKRIFRRGFEVENLSDGLEVRIKPYARTGRGDSKFRPLEDPFINFDIVDEDGTPVTVFDPPFTLRVFYDRFHFNAVGGDVDRLKLGFWQNGQWNEFTEAEHNFYITEDPNYPVTGYGTVNISEWSDPMVGWGN